MVALSTEIEKISRAYADREIEMEGMKSQIQNLKILQNELDRLKRDLEEKENKIRDLEKNNTSNTLFLNRMDENSLGEIDGEEKQKLQEENRYLRQNLEQISEQYRCLIEQSRKKESDQEPSGKKSNGSTKIRDISKQSTFNSNVKIGSVMDSFERGSEVKTKRIKIVCKYHI